MNRSLVVSIHDVSPRTREVVAAMLADLAAIGVRETSLLVIPNHHHRGHFLDDAEFCAWLRECGRTGHEPIIHGYFHQRERRADERATDKFITRLYTADEGEFYDLSTADALALVQRAEAEFAQLDLAPTGFIAPAWLLSDPAMIALQRAGLQHTTRLGAVYDLPQDRVHRSQSLVYSTRAAWRRFTSLGWNRFLAQRLRGNSLLRLGLHPPDWRYPAVRRQILELARAALADRDAITYERWLALSRHGQS